MPKWYSFDQMKVICFSQFTVATYYTVKWIYLRTYDVTLFMISCTKNY